MEDGLCAQYGGRSKRNRVIDRPRDACPEVGGLTSCGIVQIVADWAVLDFLLASIARPTSGENVPPDRAEKELGYELVK